MIEVPVFTRLGEEAYEAGTHTFDCHICGKNTGFYCSGITYHINKNGSIEITQLILPDGWKVVNKLSKTVVCKECVERWK